MPELTAADPLPTADETRAGGAGWRGRAITLLGIAVSGALLVTLYRSLDMRLVSQALLRGNPWWLAGSIAGILPITAVRALRFYWVSPPGSLRSVTEALRLTLVASAFNVFLPAKSGDLSKSYFLAKRSATSAGVSISVVVYERLCDVFALAAWCLLGWSLSRPRVPGLWAAFWMVLAVVGAASGLAISSRRFARLTARLATGVLQHRRLARVHRIIDGWPELLRSLGGRRRLIASVSVVLWLGHLVQIWLFTLALNTPVPFTASASLSAIALMAGQLPFTFAGLGTRDVALVVLLSGSGYMAPESAAAVGLLMATRNLVPPLIGLPMIKPYLASVTQTSAPDAL